MIHDGRTCRPAWFDRREDMIQKYADEVCITLT